MKLYKPSYSNQTNFSKYEYQEHISQSIEKPSNYYAHARTVLPSPSIHVQEDHNVMGNMTMHEGQVGMGEMEYGWSKKPNQYSSPAQYHQGQSMYQGGEQKAYNYGDGGFEGGYANKNTAISGPKYLSPIKTNQSGRMAHKEEHMMGNMDQGWGNSTPKFSGPTHDQHSGLAMHSEDRTVGKTGIGWDNSPTKFTRSNQSGLGMHKNEHMIENDDEVWAYPPNRFSNSNQIHHDDSSLHNENHMTGEMGRGWANSPNKFSSPTQNHQANMEMHNEGNLMGNMDQGWSNSPRKFSSPTQAHHSGLATHNQDYMGGNTSRRGWTNSPDKFSSPTQPHHSSYAAGKVDHGYANSPTKYTGPNHFSSSNNTMYGEREQHGWADKSINRFGPNQLNHSAHTPYGDYDHNVDEGVNDIMDEILTKYPSHNVSGGHGGSWAGKPNTYASQNQAMGYAAQAFAGSGQYGSTAQSMSSSSSNYAVKKELSLGFSANCNKEEYSSNISAKKFAAKIMFGRKG
ncbi:uncharacterized protein LOC110738374 [Chenopodium quinoa]|uniref:uncharacterized protein LOC110738374 n=1 Tax=Chenopodium quinoa TaxID=63459 RepID=UPI000B787DFE|nr:uncharacterized protein LOC110738374 [Chenopodium quinoa]XP_021774446.1 uncharacterized protein LOC110738374 [Chenopodium quinoa]